MKKRKIILIVTLVLLFLGIGIAGIVYAANKQSAEATNVVTVGSVNIELTMQKEEKDGTVQIEPEQNIENEISVKNTGKYAAYIRVKVTKDWKAYKSNSAVDATQIAGLRLPSKDAISLNYDTTKWKYVNQNGEDYYYYKDILPAGADSSVVFSPNYKILTEKTEGDGLLSNSILKDLDAQDISIDGDIKVVAEAIQADSVTPVKDSNGDVIGWPSENANSSIPSIDTSINSPTGEVVFNTDDISIDNGTVGSLLDIAGIMPGETVSQMIEITNSTDRTIPVYMYAKTESAFSSLTEEERELLKSLQLLVANKDGTVLYSGPMFEDDDTKQLFSPNIPVLLGTLTQGTSQDVYIAVKCPERWNKPNTKVKVLWVFSAQKATTPTPSITTPAPSAVPTVLPTSTPTQSSNVPNPTSSEITDNPEVTATPIVTDFPEKTDSVVVTTTPGKTEASKPTVTPQITETPKVTATPKPTETSLSETPIPTPTSSSGMKPQGSSDPDTTMDTIIETPETVTDKPKKTPSSANHPNATKKPIRKVDPDTVYPTKTGDITPILFWTMLCIISFIGTAWMLVCLKRDR